MAFFRKLFNREQPKQVKQATRTDSPMAFYLNGEGRIQAVKQNGIVQHGYYNQRIGLGHLIAHQEQYARAAIASVWAANCINLRADTMSRLEWLVRNKKTKEVIEGHPFVVALENSNQNIIRLLEKRLLTYGECFLKPLHNDYNYPSGFFVLNNLDVEIDTSRGYVSSFMYNPQGVGQMYTYHPKEIVYIHTDNDFDDHRGLSKFEHVLLEIHIDRDISRTTAAFYRNDARPGLLLLPEQDLTPDQGEEFIDYWNARLKGPENAGRPIIIPKVIREVVDFQRAPSLDDVELRQSTRRETCAAFKVPLSMAGAWDDATYQSLPEQRKAFYEETIVPAAEGHARDLTKHALPFFDNSSENEVYFDATKILSLVENVAEKVDVATRKLNSGAYTINEMRQSLDDDPIKGGDIHIMQSGWIPVRSNELASFEAPNTASAPEEMANPQLPEPTEEADPTEATQMITVDPTRSAKQSLDAFCGISLSNDNQLIALQRTLKNLLPYENIEWQIPSTFHITLAYSPDIGSAALFDVANGLTFDEFPILGSRLNIFENGAERALHVEIELTDHIRDIQAIIYDRFVKQGVPLSEYSNPSQYTPHITLAYLPPNVPLPSVQFEFEVLAQEVVFSRDDYEPFAVVRATSYKSLKTIHEQALKELQSWQKFVDNGKAQKRDFTTYMIREEISDLLNSVIRTGDEAAIKSAFEHAETLVAIKEVNSVRSNFELEIKSLIDGARNNGITRTNFTNRLKRSIREYTARAYRAGLTDGGVIVAPTEDLDTEDASIYRSMLAEQLRYAKGLAEQVYKKGLSDKQIRLKPRQWWNKTGLPFYDAGLLSANRNQMIEIVGIVDDNSCPTCKALAGQRHRRKTISSAGLMPPHGSGIICSEGGHCRHRPISVNSRARGNLSRVPKR